MCTTLSKFKTLLSQAKSTLSKYPTYPALMPLTSPYLACWSPHSIIIFSYKHSWRAFKASTLPCWPFLPISSNHSPCDMCHTLIGWKEAQSMCSPLSQSEPSLSLPPSFHPDRQSSHLSAYKLNPLLSHNNTIHSSTLIMPLCHPNPSWVKLLLPYCPPFITSFYIHHPQSMKHVLNYWAHIHPISNRIDPSQKQERPHWENLVMVHVLNGGLVFVYHEVMLFLVLLKCFY